MEATYAEGDKQKHPAQWALDIYDNYPQLPESFFHKYFASIQCLLIGAAAPAIVNVSKKRRMFAGVQYHLLLGALGWAIGLLGPIKDNALLSAYDARQRHYIYLHPERFPEPPRVKYGELLPPWDPIR